MESVGIHVGTQVVQHAVAHVGGVHQPRTELGRHQAAEAAAAAHLENDQLGRRPSKALCVVDEIITQ
jgi:hypothetical protein